MTGIPFYRAGPGEVAPAALEILQARLREGGRTVVRLPEEDSLRRFDDWLWTYGEDSFLPHGTEADGHAAYQPVYLTCGVEAPNGADFFLLFDGAGASADEIRAMPEVAVLFDRDRAGPVRELWNVCSGADLNPVLWERDGGGSWQPRGHRKDQRRIEDGD